MNIELTQEQADKFSNGESITIFSPATEAIVTHYGGGISFHSGPREPQELLTVSIPCRNNVESSLDGGIPVDQLVTFSTSRKE
jgi:hypothetical protein